MEKFIESSGVAGLVAAIVVVLALNLLARVGEFLWKIKEKRDAVTEKGIEKLSLTMSLNTQSLEKLELQIKTLEHAISDVNRFKQDLRRLFSALKMLAGDQWKQISREILEEEKHL